MTSSSSPSVKEMILALSLSTKFSSIIFARIADPLGRKNDHVKSERNDTDTTFSFSRMVLDLTIFSDVSIMGSAVENSLKCCFSIVIGWELSLNFIEKDLILESLSSKENTVLNLVTVHSY